MNPNIPYLSLILSFFLVFACSKSVVITEDNQEPEIIMEEDTSMMEEEMVMEEDTLMEIIEEDTLMETLNSSVYGSVYFACDYGPYYFSIDSLIANCSEEGTLYDSLNIEYIGIQDSTLVRCTYDFEAHTLSNTNNPDFTITRSTNGQTFEPEWSTTIDSMTAINFTNDVLTLENGTHPFYNAYKVNISQDSLIHLYFFNSYIGGCFHDLMIWELTTNE